MKYAFMPIGIVVGPLAGLVDHTSRRGFAKITGTWPGEERPEPA